MRNKRSLTAVQRWGAKALTLLLACPLFAGLLILTASASGPWQAEVAVPAVPRPIVTIQGNLVTEKGKPTGFYELALCVQSGRTITDRDGLTGVTPGSVISETDYADYFAVNSMEEDPSLFDIHYYPFRTASAAMNINTDILTAVNWSLTSVTYETYDAATDSYPSDALATPGVPNYPRGINTDPAAQGYAESGLLESDAFPNITTPNLYLGERSVALDVEGDARMFTAEGVVEHYENNTALITLSAAAPDNHPVVLPQSTPLVVARFSYDLKRFSTTKVSEALGIGTQGQRNSITGDIAGDGFWMGWDKTSGGGGFNTKQALTWLGESTGTFDFSGSDELISRTRGDQAVWVHTGSNEGSVTDQETYFYYYLGAEGYQNDGTDTVLVDIGGVPTEVDDVTIPKTAGQKVLTAGNDRNTGTPPAEYTYFKNLLRLEDKTLVVKLVNEPTFKKPSGRDGPIVLFYDWDDSYIGSKEVDPKGDVREQINDFVERTMIHPDLRAGKILEDELHGDLPADLDTLNAPATGTTVAAEKYKGIIDSLEREYTYRGKYSSVVDGTGVTRPSDPDPDAAWENEDPDNPGSEYVLTNKFDYVFYRHLDTVTTLEYQDAEGNTVTERYITSAPLSSDAEAALYPWVYGWAVVEDNSARNVKNWLSRRDEAQVKNVWTTFGTAGELDGLSPSYDLVTDSKGQTVPTALPAGTTPVPGTGVGGGTGIETTYSAYVDTDTATVPTAYSYALKGESAYLKLADFSDVESLLTRPGQDTIVVKAVYEPGIELQLANYSIEEVPYYNRLNEMSAQDGGAYSAEVTLERANDLLPDGYMRGSRRVRDPAVRQDTTVDQKWIADQDRGVNNDLSNPSIQTAKDRLETTYSKVDTDNGESVTFTLPLSARQNKVDYYLNDMYGYNFVTGSQRNATNYNQYGLSHAIDNYNYKTNTTDDATNDNYFDQQGIYYQAERYEVREGTHGFVLYGTLNYIMEQATRVEQGKITRSQFNTGSGYMTLRDMNLMLDGGTTQAGAGNQNTFRELILQAAAECVQYHQGDPDFWNSERDCAELTYHQLQNYLSGYGLLTRAAADAIPIDWCHLHAACFKDDQAAEAPKTWQEVLDAAGSPDKDKRDAISLLSGSLDGNIESITGLRASINGDAFSSGKSFQDKLVKAINDLNGSGRELSWANVQYAILYNAAPPSDMAGQNTALSAFWWYKGDKIKPTGATNLAELMDGAADYRGVELKDGTTVGGWRFKLEGVDNAYLNMYTGTGVVGAEWLALTENLVHHVTELPDGDQVTTSFYEEQTDYNIFEPTLLNALELAANAGADPTDQANFWPRLQYVLIHGSTTWPTAIPGDSSAEGTEMEEYWWRNDGRFMIVKDAQSMFNVAAILADPNPPADAAAQKQRDAAQAAWDKFDADRFATSAFGLFTNLRTTFDATGLPTDDFADFKSQVIAFVASGLVPDTDPTTNPDLWDQFQYYLVHNGTYDDPYMVLERNQGYYWWKNGGTSGTSVSIIGVGDLAIAGFSSKINGNAAAWDNLAQNWVNNRNFRDPDVTSDTNGDGFYLDADNDPAGNDNRFGKHTEMKQLSVTNLSAAVDALVEYRYNKLVDADPTGHYHSAPAITWLDIQHYIVTGGDMDWTGALDGSADFADEAAAQARYWWHSGGINPKKEVKTAVQSLMEDLDAMGVATLNGLTAAQAVAQVAPKLTNSEVSLRVLPTTAAIAGVNAKTAATRLATLMTNAAAAGADVTSLTWYQVQYALMPATAAGGNGGNGAYQSDPAVARAWYINNLTPAAGGGNTAGKFTADWRPAWLKTKEGANAYVATLSGDFKEVDELDLTGLSDEALDALLKAAMTETARREGGASVEETQTSEGPAVSIPAAATRPSAGTSTSAPAQPEPEVPVTPVPPAEEDNDPVEVDAPARPETPAASDPDERVELPRGEEVRSATRTPIATDGAESTTGRPIATGEQTGSGTAERTQTDLAVGLMNKVYRLELDDWRRRLGYAA